MTLIDYVFDLIYRDIYPDPASTIMGIRLRTPISMGIAFWPFIVDFKTCAFLLDEPDGDSDLKTKETKTIFSKSFDCVLSKSMNIDKYTFWYQ